MKLDRILLAVYVVALFGLLLFPLAGTSRDVLGIGADKWMHLLLFAGLAVFLRWSAAKYVYPNVITLLAALFFAVTTEAAQNLVSYRSPDIWDVIAGFLGALCATIGIDRLIRSPAPEKPFGAVVIAAGTMMTTLFLFADVIGIGTNDIFGATQIAGTLLGCAIILGGVLVYRGSISSGSAS